MRLRSPLLVLCSMLMAAPLRAELIPCPDLATARQVGACPAEEELRYTFTGFCSDNARLYNWNEEQVCSDYTLYRRLKNVALWEAEGGFQGYLSCELAPERIRTAQPSRLSVTKVGKMTRIACEYAPGVVFAHRTKAACRIEGSGECGQDAAACRVRCD